MPSPLNMLTETRSTCPYCGTGCGVIIESSGGQIVGVKGDPQHPANFGKLCSKGSALHLTASASGRLLHPSLRPSKTAARQRVSWNAALEHAANRFARVIREHGPDAVAFYISGQLLTEDYYVFNKLARALVGTNNIDSNSRLCMSSAVTAYKVTLGADAVPCSYEDFDLCDLLLLTGSNAAWAHPILFRRMEAAKANNPDLKMIVIDPRRTDTTAMADLHLQIQPGTDVVLYSAMLHVLLWEGLTDPEFIAAHTTGFEAIRDAVREITPAVAARICGVPEADILQAARWFGQAQSPLSLWCQGLNQSSHGTANGAALIHLHLATGTIGKPGMGPFSLTGQPNAMGGREVGAMANLLSAHRDLHNPDHRAEMARFWDVEQLPTQSGLTAVEMFEAVREGKIKALWIACTNPAHSLPNQAEVQAALAGCEFVVVQEAFATTETVPFADLLLPAATWGEKEGSVTNSERRITHLNAAVQAPGEALPDWDITARFARALASAMGCAEQGERLFPYTCAAEVFDEHAASTRGRDMDITGLNYDVLDFHGPQQWPMPVGAEQGKARLYQDAHFAFPDGRARFHAATYPLAALTAEQTDARFPLSLNSGRLRDQWHGMSRTGRTARLTAHAARPVIHVHPSDLERRQIVSGELIRVVGRRGEGVWECVADTSQKVGQTYIPMHWGGNSLAHAGVNVWMPPAVDPLSRQPELKHAAVRIEKLEAPLFRATVLVMAGPDTPLETVLDWRQGLLHRLLEEGEQATASAPVWQSLTVVGSEQRQGVCLELAWAERPLHLRQFLDDCLAMTGFSANEGLQFHDAARAIDKRAVFAGLGATQRLQAIAFAGELKALAWIRTLLLSGEPVQAYRAFLFAPTDKPPVAGVTADRTVCSCFNVGEQAIQKAIAAGADLEALQAKLKCGTGCGSCVPEIRRML